MPEDRHCLEVLRLTDTLMFTTAKDDGLIPYVLTQILDACVNGITLSDPDLPDNPIVYANKVFEDLSGYSQAEVVGRNCRFLQGDDREQEALTTDPHRVGGAGELRGDVAELPQERRVVLQPAVDSAARGSRRQGHLLPRRAVRHHRADPDQRRRARDPLRVGARLRAAATRAVRFAGDGQTRLLRTSTCPQNSRLSPAGSAAGRSPPGEKQSRARSGFALSPHSRRSVPERAPSQDRLALQRSLHWRSGSPSNTGCRSASRSSPSHATAVPPPPSRHR